MATAAGTASAAAKQLFLPKYWLRNAGIGALAYIALPAAAAAAGASAAGASASAAFTGAAAQQVVGGGTTIINAVPGALSSAWDVGSHVVSGVAAMPWSEMANAATSAAPAAAAD